MIYIKNCTVCKEGKPLSNFYKRKASEDGYAYRCKLCDKTAGKAYIKSLDEKVLFEKRRSATLKFKYNLTPEQVDIIYKDQNGVCAICKTEGFLINIYVKYPLVVDHCHKTGKIRGLLCNNCNRGLGLFKDSIESLTNAAKYINKKD